jgi:hypothetical protein
MKKRTRSKNPKSNSPRKRTKPTNGNGKNKLGHFTPGNKWWAKRSSHGRNPKFGSPEELRAACQEYFEFVDETPLWERRVVGQYYGEAVMKDVPKMRPMTIGGLCLFLDIVRPTWEDYKSKTDFSSICVLAEETIREQKFAGASAGFFNHAIIARDLGLVDRADITSKDEALEVTQTVIVLPAKVEEE